MYLLSTKEVWGSGIALDYDTATSETRQLDYYYNLGVNSNNFSGLSKFNQSGVAYNWWLRSNRSNYSYYFYYVASTGDWNVAKYNLPTSSVSPAFRIG